MGREEHSFRDGAKALLILAAWVAGSVMALVLIATGAVWLMTPEFDFELSGLDISELNLIDYSHPYFAPAGSADETHPWVSVRMLLYAPETVFTVAPGESHEAAASRLLPLCKRVWLVWPEDDAKMHRLLVEWLDQAAADRHAFVRDFGVSASAVRARPACDPTEWTDATPGGRYRYLMTRLQLSLLERVLGGKWHWAKPREETAEGHGLEPYTRFLFEWK